MPTIQEIQQRCRALAGTPAPAVVAPVKNDPKYWFAKTFTDDEVAEIKRLYEQKCSELVSKNGLFNHQVSIALKAWVGDLGEMAFSELLSGPYKYIDGIHFIRHTKQDYYDNRDFTLVGDKYSMEIDVKTSSGNYDPKLIHTGHVSQAHYEKLKKVDYPINTLVFANYNMTSRTVHIIGFLPKKEFFDLAIFMDVGDKHNEVTCKSPMWIVDYEQLRPFRKVVG